MRHIKSANRPATKVSVGKTAVDKHRTRQNEIERIKLLIYGDETKTQRTTRQRDRETKGQRPEGEDGNKEFG